MKVTISTTDEFDRCARRLAKKYKSLKDDLRSFQQEMMENPLMGTDLGRGVRKIRAWPSVRKARVRAVEPVC